MAGRSRASSASTTGCCKRPVGDVLPFAVCSFTWEPYLKGNALPKTPSPGTFSSLSGPSPSGFCWMLLAPNLMMVYYLQLAICSFTFTCCGGKKMAPQVEWHY